MGTLWAQKRDVEAAASYNQWFAINSDEASVLIIVVAEPVILWRSTKTPRFVH